MKTESVPAHYREPHYSARLYRAQYQYIAKHYDKEMYETCCKELGMPLSYLLQDDSWVSDRFAKDLMEKLIQATGDRDLPFKFGRYGISPEALSPLEYFANLTIGFPLLVFHTVPLQFPKYNNVNRIKIDRWRPGHFEYVMRPRGKRIASAHICRNTQGFLSGFQQAFGFDKVEVTHTQCLHRGGTECRFIIEYSAGSFWKHRLLLLASSLGTGASLWWLFRRFIPESISHNSFGVDLFFLSYLGFTLSFMFGKRYLGILRYVQQYNEQSQSKSAELHENYLKLEHRFQESTLLRELSLKLSETATPREVILLCLEEMEKRFGYSRTLVMLLSSDRFRLYTAEVRGFSRELRSVYQLSLRYPADRNNPALFANVLEKGETRAVFEMEQFKALLKADNRELIESFGLTSLIICPIQDREEKYGLLVVGSAGKDRLLTKDDQILLESISRLLSLSFQSASNLERETGLKTLFQKYVPAVVLDGLGTDKSKGALAPTARPIASLFVDLRDFTTRAEGFSPEKTVEMLNLYTDYVTARIAAAGGIIDKLVGDGVNAFFPEDPRFPGEHAKTAFLAALYLLSDLEELAAVFRVRGYGAAQLGVGIHVGPATIGTMGCDRKLDYTAVGDTVNTAARLQELSKSHREKTASGMDGVILISEEGFRISQIPVEAIDVGMTTIRGRSQKLGVFYVDQKSAEIWVRKTGKSFSQINEVLNTLGHHPHEKKAA